MTAYATCAFPECYAKIPYNPKTDTTRPRYCKTHIKNNPRELYITINPKPLLKTSPQKSETPPPDGIFVCPKCKIRKTVLYKDFCDSVGMLTMKPVYCPNPDCNGTTMVYHMDAVVKRV